MTHPPRDPPPLEQLVPEFADRFDAAVLTDIERASIERRLIRLRRALRRLGEETNTLRWPLDLPPPRHRDAPTREGLIAAMTDELLHGGDPGLKRSVARRAVDKLGRHYLWRNLATLPVFHELTVLGPWYLTATAVTAPQRRLVDALVRELLFGIVLSVQRVRQDILEADEVYLGHCACRSAGVVDDLEAAGRVFTLLSEADNRRLLDRLIDRYRALGPDRLRRTTDPRYRRVLASLDRQRRRGAASYRVETLLRETYPDWELVVVHPRYTGRWVRSLRNNRKARAIDRELAVELVNILYLSRGTVFNSMTWVDSPYCICSCPSPELDGGCVLTNWTYHGGLNHAVVPAEDHHGRRRDARGQVRPCRFFPVRARHDCLGCGYAHDESEPRGVDLALRETDELLGRP